MDIIVVVLIGLIIGAIAKLLVPGPDSGGLFFTAFLGVVGAVVATFIGQWLGFYAHGEPAGFVSSILGAILVLLLHRKLSHRSIP